MNSFKYLRRFSHRTLLVLMAITLASCLPQEDSLTEDSLQGAPGQSYGGFQGLDSVETEAATKIRLRWTPTDDPRVVAYNIYDVTLASQPRLIRTVNPLTSEATIAGLSHGFYYAFRVRAADVKNREDSNTKDLVGIPYGGILSVSVLSSSTAKLTFADASAGEARETNVYCKTSSSNPYELVANLRDIYVTHVTLEDLVPNTTYTCRAAIVVDGNEDNNKETVVFQALGKADSIVFDPQPGNGAAGDVLSQQPVVRILDENGNIVAGGPDSNATITLTVSEDSPTVGVVSGTYTMTAVAGVAQFLDIHFNESGVKILKATKEDTSSAEFGTVAMDVDSNTFTISAGAVSPDHSTLKISPESPPAEPMVADGVASYQVVFKLMDSFGNAVSGVRPQFNSNIVGDILSQPLLNTDANGETSGSIVTTIADTNPARVLSITSPAGLSTVQTLAPFKHGPAAKLAFTIQPVTSPAGEFSLSQVRVAIQDQAGNIVTTGAAASSVISLTIANNTQGAVLSGTTSKAATNGIATFDDLGIDLTGMQYRLRASSLPLIGAESNSFNVTAGTPQIVGLTGPTEVNSGECSTAIVLQLQDGGGNPANAAQATSIQISGLGASTLHSSSSCGGNFNSLVTFTPGTHTRTFYLRNNKAAALTVTATDLSNILTPGSLNLNVNANKVKLTAQSSGAPEGTMRVPAGQCSVAMLIATQANDNSTGPIFSARSVSMVGLGSFAKIYSDSSCVNEIDPAGFPLDLSPALDTKIYLKSPRGETLSGITINDSSSNLTTVSSPQTVIVTASEINLAGPASVVAGQCSSAFTVTLRDTLGNTMPVDADTPLSISGVHGVSATGKFYTSPACSGGGFTSDIVMPASAGVLQMYFKGVAAEVLNIQITDDSGNMSASNVRQLVVSPSAFELAAPGPPYTGYSASSNCAGPFKVRTLDGLGDPADAVVPITAVLSGAGDAGGYYSDFDCTAKITQVQFTAGQGLKNVYLRGDYPESNLTLTVTDQAGVLSPATLNWQVTGRVSWLGTASSLNNDLGELMPFTSGLKPVAARYDGVYSAMGLSFSPDHKYLYVADYYQHKIIKYDYLEHKYLGWIGSLYKEAGVGSSGSNVDFPTNSHCINAGHAQPLPGWCTGGNSWANNGSHITSGGIYTPYDVVDDGQFIYVANTDSQVVSRFYSETGVFAGWMGRVNASPSGAGPGGPGTCSSALNNTFTPGWCMGGSFLTSAGHPTEGDGRMRAPMSLAFDATYLYVGAYGAILRYRKDTGAFQGWIGMVEETPTGGYVAGCNLTGAGSVTPGWCTGGTYREVGDPRNYNGVAGGIQQAGGLLVDGNYLYVVNRNTSGIIGKYNKNTGSFDGILPQLNFTWSGPRQIATDGNTFYIADNSRLIKTNKTGLVTGWIGKVLNNFNLIGPGCPGLITNQNTPGWCEGGTHRPGFDEDSFYSARSIAYDGNGYILAGSERYSGIAKFDATTGALVGTLGLRSLSPHSWSNNSNLTAEFHGFDDYSLYEPRGTTVAGDYLFVTESGSSRVKKINRKTGELLGWIGGNTSMSTGGESSNCLSGNGMGPSPGWCLGANFLPRFAWNTLIQQNVPGMIQFPFGITSDGTWIYVTDYDAHRIQRYRVDDGTYGGWLGRISSSPTGGGPNCNGAPVDSFTPGWCTGGYSKSGNGDGHLYYPTEIHHANGILYVVDGANHRISSYSTITGAFNGWIGRIASGTPAGCTTINRSGYNVSASGWCLGGTASAAATNDRGGGFHFRDNRYAGITSDSTYLYIGNGRLRRVDRIKIADGTYHGASQVNELNYTLGWETDGVTIAGMQSTCSNPVSLWTDGTNLYGTSVVPCNRDGTTFVAWKMDTVTGKMVGWSGGISFNNSPIAGDPGCQGATDYTPGWCQGGRMGMGLKLGQFAGDWGRITGDDHFVYVTDQSANRVTRFPK